MPASLGCVFCAIVDGSAPADVVYGDDHAVAFMDIRPMTPGHTLVVPRRHAPDLWGLTEDEIAPFMTAVTRVARQVRDALRPDGLNLLQSNGAAAWQSVFHLHVHVLPRTAGDLPVPTMITQAQPGDADERAALAVRIREGGDA